MTNQAFKILEPTIKNILTSWANQAKEAKHKTRISWNGLEMQICAHRFMEFPVSMNQTRKKEVFKRDSIHPENYSFQVQAKSTSRLRVKQKKRFSVLHFSFMFHFFLWGNLKESHFQNFIFQFLIAHPSRFCIMWEIKTNKLRSKFLFLFTLILFQKWSLFRSFISFYFILWEWLDFTSFV